MVDDAQSYLSNYAPIVVFDSLFLFGVYQCVSVRYGDGVKRGFSL